MEVNSKCYPSLSSQSERSKNTISGFGIYYMPLSLAIWYKRHRFCFFPSTIQREANACKLCKNVKRVEFAAFIWQAVL